MLSWFISTECTTSSRRPPQSARRILFTTFVAALLGVHSPSAHAKHLRLDNDAAPGAPPAAADAPSGKSTIIRGEILEVHDRLAPAAYPGILRLHKFTATLSGNQVSETWTDTFNYKHKGMRMRGRRAIAKGIGNISELQDEDSGTIGAYTQNVVWHVLDQRRLRRIFTGQNFLLIVDIQIDDKNDCHIEAKYLKQAGFESITMTRTDTAEPASFGLPRIGRASCTIE